MSKSGTNRFTGELSASRCRPRHGRRSSSGQRVALRAGPQLDHGNVGGPILPNKLLSTAPTTGPRTHTGEPRQPVRRAAGLREHRERGLRQADLHADQLGAAQRQLPRLASRTTPATCSPRTPRRRPAPATRPSRRSASLEGSWVINSRSHATFRYTDFANETQGGRQHLASVAVDRHRHALDIGRLDQIGRSPFRAGRRPAAYNDFVQPLIDRYGYVQNGVQRRRRHRRLRHDVRRGRLLPRRGQVGYNLTFGSGVTHDLHVGYQRYVDGRGPDPQLERLGLDHRARRPPELQRHADLLHRRVPAAGARPRADDPLRVPVAELRGQRHHPLAQLDVQRRRARQQRHALRPGAARGFVDALRLRPRARATSTRCTTSRSAR